jgi:hypothetical protein
MPDDKHTIHHQIKRGAVYSLEAARAALGLARATLRREIRLGRLRVAKRAGRYYLLGSWLLEWLRQGEARRPGRHSQTLALLPRGEEGRPDKDCG